MFKATAAGAALAIALAAAAPARATTCDYYIDYIKDESERDWAINKVYHYTPERLEAIKALKDQGEALCTSGDEDQGKEVLLEAIKIISFTRLR